MKNARSWIAPVSIAIAGVSGAMVSSNAATVKNPSVRSQMVSCATISQSDYKAPVGSVDHLRVAMPPYTAILNGVVENAGAFSNSATHPLSIDIVDGNRAVATSTLLAYSGGGLGVMAV